MTVNVRTYITLHYITLHYITLHYIIHYLIHYIVHSFMHYIIFQIVYYTYSKRLVQQQNTSTIQSRQSMSGHTLYGWYTIAVAL